MNKKEKAQFLLEELGEIDERFIEECQNSPLQRRRAARRTRRLTAALIAALIALGVATVGILVRTAGGFSSVPAPEPSGNAVKGTPSESYGVSDSLPAENAPGFDNRILFCGNATVIWQEAGEEKKSEYISDSTYRDIEKIAEMSGKNIQESRDDATKIWVCDGRGNVFSPELMYQKGNFYFGTLFDYNAEMVLSEELRKILRNIIPQ